MSSNSASLISKVRQRSRPPAWIVLSVWLVVIAGLAVLGTGIEDRLAPTSINVPGTPSDRARQVIEDNFGQSVPIAILLEGPEAEIERQGPRLVQAFRDKGAQVLSPWGSAKELSALRPEPDAALVVVDIPGDEQTAISHVLPLARRTLDKQLEPPVEHRLSGVAVIGEAIEAAAIDGTHKAERIALPVLLIVLILVFRTPMAAIVPLLIGAATVFAGRGLLLLATNFVSINALGVAMASMMGLALGVDYALLMVSRLRQERESGASHEEALETARSVAGRTIVFAGGTLVLAMLTATLIASGSLLASVATGVVISGAFSVLLAISLMPALLSVMGSSLERWRLPMPKRRKGSGAGLAAWLISKPAVSVPLILAITLALAAPAAAISLGPPDVRQLPESDPVRKDFERIEERISPGWSAPYVVVATAKDGVMTEPRKLRALTRWQEKIAESPHVEAVIGPTALSGASRLHARAGEEYRSAPKRLADAREGIEELRSGLQEAKEGAIELGDGLAAMGSGADRLGSGAEQAREGAGKLRRGIERAGDGSSRLAGGLDRALDGAGELHRGNRELAEGAERLSREFARLDGALRGALAPLAAVSGQMVSWADWIDSLRGPAETAITEMEKALRDMEEIAARQGDPLFPELRRAIETAYAMITGLAPEGAELPQLPPAITIGPFLPEDMPVESVRGIGPVLLAMGEQMSSAARQFAAIPDQLDELTDGLDQLNDGMLRLTQGAREAERGAGELERGIRQLSRGAHRLDGGIQELGSGAVRLEDGIGALAAGAGRLSEGLARGEAGAGELEEGLGRPDGPLSEYAMVLSGYEDDLERIDRTAPGAIDSGYLMLTALDGLRPGLRDQVSQVVSVDGGGQSLRMMIVPKAGPNTPISNRVGELIERRMPALAQASGSTVEVGEGAQSLSDYADATRERLPMLILALAIVSVLTLTLVVRSLILPLVAVALTLLTVGTAFGGLELLQRSGIMQGPRYIDAISAAGILAIMFVLAIDYMVFLLTRMREGWLKTGDHKRAIRYGVDRTAGVITGAAAIMAAVFIAFANTEIASLKQFGAGLTIAVLLDATVVRLVLLPAIMRGIGPRCWWMPRWLDERLPNPEPPELQEQAAPELPTTIRPAARPEPSPDGSGREAEQPSVDVRPAARPEPSPDGSGREAEQPSVIGDAWRDHAEFVVLLSKIGEASDAGQTERVRELSRRLRRMAIPHFEYEQRSVFPGLVDMLGAGYIERLHSEQDGVVAALDRIESLAANGRLRPSEAAEIKRHARAATATFATCDGVVALAEATSRKPINGDSGETNGNSGGTNGASGV